MNSGAEKLGLIVNPVAGLGGRVGLKGSDGPMMQRKALDLGAIPSALNRASEALAPLRRIDDLQIFTWSGQMGEDAARAAGFSPNVAGTAGDDASTPEDTRAAAAELRAIGVDLLIFAGGDGTARDICASIGESVPVIGIPAGVKIYSAVFAKNPPYAGELAALFLEGRSGAPQSAEVMDVDEDAARDGRVSANLYGYLQVPARASLVQTLKAASGPGEAAAMDAIAAAVTRSMAPNTVYLVGPGTTTRAIFDRLGLHKTLIGVDAIENGELVAGDLNESQILSLVQDHAAKIIVTPIGGQGCIFGRGNQQLSAGVLARLGADNVIVVSTPTKLNALPGGILWVDTGDRDVDAMLSGHVRVITGYKEEAVCRVES